ncbi:hypothetical protein EMIHUDRAFT_231042 [Emiliania huxleyi CCMP1516]|uniref:Isopenicillin N synthase-like Fe(2+) 2OG dioxygenase domain-containing protein n=2 Tax=Emiliania huxleyi TaxID=2903 RepID=A0A0D3HZU0_EMIH1|nr:hypothetical protein EMIHUDRAFT_221009 [Emiliania huxleyi CCMP1516]XP_005784723.1 hypothetical protein EMIHUDRAFT_231042 [Emiliania huxleyi CCMP1516]EOD04525.1 hypothetical protein EMIHUDRAFT_221009 [Emiliania huxleyi CCMP1516]EOD32294.1 hypothetical protein EMIHUDRAFT_231042 [Emiliania huxleyi CCMP1516]|eukprot:XP_005756954.1 hypothetical protein EMIHUDRAFT_221009 [Emiliania huxleyi CCMP1516]
MEAFARALLGGLERAGGVSSELREAAEELLLGGEGTLHPLDPRCLPWSAGAPFAAWRTAEEASNTVMLVLVDLSGEAGEASLPLPADLLGRWPRRALLRLSQHRLVVAPGPPGELTERFGGGSGASGEAAPPPEPELYSADELRRGSLTTR